MTDRKKLSDEDLDTILAIARNEQSGRITPYEVEALVEAYRLAPSPAIGRETVTDEMVERAAFAAWASTTPFAGQTEAEFRASAKQVLVADLDGDTTLEHDMLLDWDMNKPTFCVLARAALEAALRSQP